MRKTKLGQKALSLALAAVLLLSLAVFPSGGSLAASHGNLTGVADYIAAKYAGVETGHVFESVTYERLLRILRTDGNHIVVFSSPGNATSQASLQYINEAAKDYGVQTIYHFDPHLAEGTGQTGLDITLPDAAGTYNGVTKSATAYNKLWTTATNPYSASGVLQSAQLAYISDAYKSSDTDLFVFNRRGDGTAIVDDDSTIRSELLITSAAQVTGDVNAFKAQVESVFAAVGAKNDTNESRQTQYEFFKSAVASNPTIDASIEKVSGATSDDFPAVEITYSELLWLLDQTGDRNFLVAGTWCGDTRAAFGYLVENAIRFTKGTPVYVFDFRMDGNLAGASAQGIGADETATVKNGTGYVQELINQKLGPHKTGINNAFRYYYPEGDTTQALVKRSSTNFRSPYLFAYNKDGNPKTTKEWVHTLQDYEKPWNASATGGINGPTYNAVEGGPGKAGDFLDYELSTGGLPANIVAKGRAALGEFFGGALASGHRATITVDESGSADNGCGDDNDALDDIGEDILIPNHGTYSYDVQNYDIKVEFLPDKFEEEDAFEAQTVITATAKEVLHEISLDFRRQVLSADHPPVVEKVTLADNGDVLDRENVTVTQVERLNDDSIDQQKLNLKLGASLTVGQVFQVTVTYTTGLIDSQNRTMCRRTRTRPRKTQTTTRKPASRKLTTCPQRTPRRSLA